MKQYTLPEDTQNLFEQLCQADMLQQGFKMVKKNNGAPGIDGITIEDFQTNLTEELAQLQQELESWCYKPMPVKRVEIEKPTGGIRLLGIPTVRDRVVHATLKILIEPTLEQIFSDNSFGFRPKRNQRQAVEAAQKIIKTGKVYTVDIDLSKFFDRINHDRLISRLGLFIKDKRILRLIGNILRSGVMIDGLVSPTNEGSVQGSPLSPLLSNLVLDELDKELEKRNLEFCRFADDCNIFVKTRRSAQRVMQNISKFIENKLKLKVNTEKSKATHSRNVKFLGMTIINGTIAISRKAMKSAMTKVKLLIPRGTHLSWDDSIKRVNEWYMGWSGYYGMTQYPAQLRKIESHIRRRFRARIITQQKLRRNLYKCFTKRNIKRKTAARTAFSNNGKWAMSNSYAMHRAFNLHWFKAAGLKTRTDTKQKHWFNVNRWVYLP